jgi:hypothetical protein
VFRLSGKTHSDIQDLKVAQAKGAKQQLVPGIADFSEIRNQKSEFRNPCQ